MNFEAGVAGQRAGQQVRLAQDLEPVADAEHRQAGPGGGHQLAHHRGEPGDGTAAQVVAVGEAAGQDRRVHAAQVAVAVPEHDRFGPGEPDRTRRVPVIQRPRKSNDPNPHARSLFPSRAISLAAWTLPFPQPTPGATEERRGPPRQAARPARRRSEGGWARGTGAGAPVHGKVGGGPGGEREGSASWPPGAGAAARPLTT